MSGAVHRESVTIVNARIESASIQLDLDTFLCCWLFLDYGDSSGQGFGGFVLGGIGDAPASKHATQPNICGEYLVRVMEIAGVDNFKNLPGKVIRVKQEGGLVVAIGHPLKDIWFEPRVALKAMTEGRGGQ